MFLFPLVRFTRKSVRQTFWIGAASAVASIVWLIGSVFIAPSFSSDENVQAGIVLLPSVLLFIVAAGFLGAWISFHWDKLLGITGYDEDD